MQIPERAVSMVRSGTVCCESLRRTKGFERLFIVLRVSGLLLLVCTSCRTPDSRARRASSGELSVKPGINDPYENPDVDTWVRRFESESREIFAHRVRIAGAVGIAKGMTVADIGAGTGLFTPLFAEAVGAEGKVLAVDIVPEFLELIRTRAREQHLTNVETVLCSEDSVRLPPASVDLAFVCDTYHHFEYPSSTLRSIHRALKPGGQLVVIDFIKIEGKSRDWIMNHVRAAEDITTAEIVAAGFTRDSDQPDSSFLQENYILRFRKAGP